MISLQDCPPTTLHPVLGALFAPLMAARGEAWALKDAVTGRYVQVSPEWLAWLGRPAEAVIGHADPELFDASVHSAFRAAESTVLAQDAPLASEHRFEHQGQRQAWGVWRVLTPPDAAGRRWLCSVWRDLAEEQRQQAQLRTALQQIEQQQQALEALRRECADQVLRDAVSGLQSRAHFEDQLRREVDLSTREHREFALVFVAIDPPNNKVQALGREAQVRVLETMGTLLRSGTRAMDASCRLDEGRFAVLLSGVGLATAHARMEGLRRKCATQIVMHGGQELGFTASMGVASFPHTEQTQEALIAACEAALAEAQRRGGNHVTLAAIRLDSGSQR